MGNVWFPSSYTCGVLKNQTKKAYDKGIISELTSNEAGFHSQNYLLSPIGRLSKSRVRKPFLTKWA